jgi:hypothetical protein
MPLPSATFRCGHPREPGNTHTRQHDGYQTCALCKRIRTICRSVERTQDRINKGRLTLGERIVAGLA